MLPNLLAPNGLCLAFENIPNRVVLRPCDTSYDTNDARFEKECQQLTENLLMISALLKSVYKSIPQLLIIPIITS